VAAVVEAAGAEGRAVRLLNRRVGQRLADVIELSVLTSELTVAYVERVAAPMSAMSLATGARCIARGYVAHLLIEEDPAAFGVVDIPVLGTLPPLRRGRPPQDLLTRVVKATRRHFYSVCCLSPEAWDAFLVATTAEIHAEALAGATDGEDREGAGLLAPELVDGLLRTGWLLRQVDLAYGLQPVLRD
jgi:hypothetical protein